MSSAVHTFNQMAESWWPWTVRSQFQALVVLALVLSILLVWRRASPRWRYGLLLIALVKFAIPPTAPSFGLFSVLPSPSARPVASDVAAIDVVRTGRPSEEQISLRGETLPVEFSASAAAVDVRRPDGERPESEGGVQQANSPIAGGKVTPAGWGLIAQILGSVGMVILVTTQGVRLRRKVRQAERISGGRLFAIADDVSRRIGLGRLPAMHMDGNLRSPQTGGFLRPFVLLPRWIEEADEEEQAALVSHELAHIARRDSWVNWFQIAMQAWLWWNPLVWWLNRRIRVEREMCCDDLVLGLGITGGESYSQVLLSVAGRLSRREATMQVFGMADTFVSLKSRVARILDTGIRRPVRLSLFSVVALGAFAILVLPGSSPARWENVESKVAVTNEEAGDVGVNDTGAEATGIPAPPAGAGRSFDGVDDFLEVPDSEALDMGDFFTVEVWVKPGEITGQDAILSKEVPWKSGWTLIIEPPPFEERSYPPEEEHRLKVLRIRFGVGDGDGFHDLVASVLQTGPVIEKGFSFYRIEAWRHVAVTWNRGKGIIYVNGGPLAEDEFPGAAPARMPLRIGKGSADLGRHFNGKLAEIRIWDVVRTPEQIEANMSKRLTGKEPGLIAYWPLDDPPGMVAGDLTPNNRYARPYSTEEVNYLGQKDFPRIVSLDPPNGAEDVDPSREHITITFDRPMRNGYSWVDKGMRPQLDEVKWISDRECRALVTLERGREYGVWLNFGPRTSHFRSVEGAASNRFYWSFRTKSTSSPKTETGEIGSPPDTSPVVETVEIVAKDLSLAGTVTDRSGRPVSGVEISNFYPHGSNPQITYTDGEGKFHFEKERGYVVIAKKEGMVPVFYEFKDSLYHNRGEPIRLGLTMGEGGTVEGTIVSEKDGKPIEGADVWLDRWAKDTDVGVNRYIIWTGKPVKSDERGEFRLSGAPDGMLRLHAKGGGYAEEISPEFAVGEGETAEVSLELYRGMDLFVRTIDQETEEPVPGVSVYVAGAEKTTDQDGRCVFPNLSLGGIGVMCRAEGYHDVGSGEIRIDRKEGAKEVRVLMRRRDEGGPGTATSAPFAPPMYSKIEAAPDQDPIPEGAKTIGYVDDSPSSWNVSLGPGRHAVEFERPEGLRFLEAVQIAAQRYGNPVSPAVEFHLHVLDGEKRVLADVPYPYSLIKRLDLRWYTLRTPSIEVPERFLIALAFNSDQTKGIYLGLDTDVTESHSYIGLPDSGLEKSEGEFDWMIRACLSDEPTEEKGTILLRSRAEWSPPETVPAKKTEGPAPRTDDVETRLAMPVTLTMPYPKFYEGSPTDKTSVQYAVIAVLQQVGLSYDWDTSYKNTDPICRKWIYPEISDVPCRDALRTILEPVDLDFVVRDHKVVLVRTPGDEEPVEASPPGTVSKGVGGVPFLKPAGSSLPIVLGPLPVPATERGDLIIPAQHVWSDTRLELSEGNRVSLIGRGSVRGCLGPPGHPAYGPWTPAGFETSSGERACALIGALVGEGRRDEFFVGEKLTFTAPFPGRLLLGVSESGARGKVGAFQVSVAINGTPVDFNTLQVGTDAPSPLPSGGLLESDGNTVALWHFNNIGSDDTLYDSSAKGNHGEIWGAEWVDGVEGGALRFDGKDDVVVVPGDASMNLGDRITIEALVNPDPDLPPLGAIIERGQGLMHHGGYYMRFNDWRMQLEIALPFVETLGQTRLQPGEWYYVAASYDNDRTRIYVNGKLDGELHLGEGHLDRLNDYCHVNIGLEGGIHYFKGVMDELRVSNVARTPREIEENWNVIRSALGRGVKAYPGERSP